MKTETKIFGMWGVYRLQVHGICNHRQVYRKVVEALDLYLNWIYIRLSAQALYLIFFVCATTLRRWLIYEIVTLLMSY